METKLKNNEWRDWYLKSALVLGHLGGIAFVAVGYLYFSGGYLHVEKPIEVLQAQCEQIQGLEKLAFQSMRLDEPRKKR